MDMIKKNNFWSFITFQYGILILLFATVICAGFSGCGEKKSPAINDKYGGVIYFGVEAPFHGFDVLGTSGFINPTQAPLNNLIQEPLFRMDKSGNLIPVLGLTASQSATGDVWEVKLREGVLFHDGTAFNADAVIQH